jgi:hypothetical protein
MEYIQYAILVGVLSYEMVYSDLSYYVKRFLLLDKNNLVIELLSTPMAYLRLFGNYTYLLLPIILFMLLSANIHRFLYKLLQCPYCLAIWVGLFTGLLVAYSLPEAIVLGFSGSLITAIYSKLRN